jgi:RHS repeat-associated protein
MSIPGIRINCRYPISWAAPTGGGNYWSDYDGVDGDGDGLGDTPYIIDADNQDEHPLVIPLLELSSAPGNPDNQSVTVTPENEKRIAVLKITLALSDQAPEPVRIDALQFDFQGESLAWNDQDMASIAESVDTVFLLEQDPENYQSPETVIGQSSGALQMTFSGLNRTLAPGDSRQYILEYLIEKTDPACAVYGAMISPEQVTAGFASGSGNVPTGGQLAAGTVFREGMVPQITMSPIGAGTVIMSPDQSCYSWNDEIEFTITPSDGYAFSAFQDNAGTFTGENPLNITVTWGDTLDYSTTIYFKETIPPPADGKKHLGLEDPVHTGTGEFYFERPLFNLGGPLPLFSGLYYGSNVARRITNADIDRAFGHVLGPMWLHNFQILRLYKGDQETHIIYDRGQILRFKQQGDAWDLISDVETPFALKADLDGNYYLLDPTKELIFVFNPARRLERISDRNGNQLQLSYDQEGNLTQVSDGLGRTLYYTYSGSRLTGLHDGLGRNYTFGYTENRLSSITDPMGNVTTYTYDSDGNGLITGVTYPGGHTPYIQDYNDQGRVVSQTDVVGNVTSLSFGTDGGSTITYPDGTAWEHRHSNWNVLSGYTDPQGGDLSIDYDANSGGYVMTDRLGDQASGGYHEASGNLAWLTNARGETTTYTYAGQEQSFGAGVDFTFYDLTLLTYPDGTNEEFSYDNRGNVLERRDRVGESHRQTYNAKGQLLTLTNPAAGEITFTYNPDGTVASFTTTDTGVTAYEYDGYKRVVGTTNPDGSFTRWTYELDDRITAITDENGYTHTYTYDAEGNLTAVTDPLGHTSGSAYDAMGRLVRITDALGGTATLEYDIMGRLARVTDGNGHNCSYEYDAAGRQFEKRDAAGQIWETAYDREGMVTATTTPLGYVTRYSTDQLGRMAAITDPLGHRIELIRDVVGRVRAVKDPPGRESTFTYDAGGMVVGISKPGLGSIHYQRNELGLLSQLTDFNGANSSFTYTPMGRITGYTDPLGNTWSYEHDLQGRTVRALYPDGGTLELTYDAVGNIVRRQYTDGPDLYFDHNALHRVTATNGLSLTYDALGRVTNTTGADGSGFGAAYDTGGRLVTVTYEDDLFSVTYEYEARNLLTAVSDSLTGTRVEFTYDVEGRLTGINRGNGVSTAFTLDAADRPTGIKDGILAEQRYTYDGADQVTGVVLDLPLDPSPFPGIGTKSYAYDVASRLAGEGYRYDSRGRLTASPDVAFTWDGAGRLTGVDGVRLEYNGLGNLIRRRDGAAETGYHYNYALAAPVIVAEKENTAGEFRRSYIWTPAGTLLYAIDRQDGNRVFFYHFDAVGSTLFLTGRDGQVSNAYAYTPHGEILQHEGAIDQPFTYLGQHGVRREGTDGLYQMQARYYDAGTGRFLSRDPGWLQGSQPEELNPYLYARNNPLKYIDPEGWLSKGFQRAAEGVKRGMDWLKGKKPVRGAAGANDKTHGESQRNLYYQGAGWLANAGYFAQSFIPGSNEIDDLVVYGKGGLEDIGAGIFRDLVGTPTTLLRTGVDLGTFLLVDDSAREAGRTYAAWLKGEISDEAFAKMRRHYLKDLDFLARYQMATGVSVLAMAELTIDGTRHLESGLEIGFRNLTGVNNDTDFGTLGGAYALVSGSNHAQQQYQKEIRKSKNPFVKSGAWIGATVGGWLE